MSRVTQIEAALRRLDQGGFQRLADAYLMKRGYDLLIPIGLSLGSEKTAVGTPDSLVLRADGMYVFAEYTTQQKGLAGKFANDLASCFNEAKTGIPPDRIAEIILCHTGRLTAAEVYELREQGAAYATPVQVIGPGTLAHEISEKFPRIASEYLGIEPDTGQVLTPHDFVNAYGKGAFATPLDTEFQFREEQLELVLERLRQRDVVLLSGRPGVGKSRLALEALRRFSTENPGTQAWCVFNRGADLFHDLRTHFAAPGHYVLLVDDANRLTRFEYALDLLRDNSPDRSVKIVSTVRDYALEQVQQQALKFGAADPVMLEPMNDEQIGALIRQTYGIEHHAYLERITEVAAGNPRLALMAGRVAHETSSLEALTDVSTLYNEYFRSIREDIDDLRDPSALRIAGVVSFFRHVDRSNAQLMGTLSDTFDIYPDEFWVTVRKLHELEVFDLYANEVVRVSDQVLSTYLFHRAAISDRTLDLSALLLTFFPQFRLRFIEALNPVISTFDSTEVGDVVRAAVLDCLPTFEQRPDNDAVLQLLDTFAAFVPDRALAHASRMIAELTQEDVSGPATFVSSNDSVPSPSALSILSRFAFASEADRAIALELLVTHLQRQPSSAPHCVRILTDTFGIRHGSYLHGYLVQRHTAEVLAHAARQGHAHVPSRLFLAFAREQLKTEFDQIESKGGNAFTIYRFVVPATEELLELRAFLWDQITKLADVGHLGMDVESLLASYADRAFRADAVTIIAADMPAVSTLVERCFDPSNFRHVAIIREWWGALDRLELTVDDTVRDLFSGESLNLYNLLVSDFNERRELGWQDAQRLKSERLRAAGREFSPAQLRHIARRAADLRMSLSAGHQRYEVEASITEIFREFANTYPDELISVVLEQLQDGNRAGLHAYAMVDAIIGAIGADAAYDRLAEGRCDGQVAWLAAYFRSIPIDAVPPQRLEEFAQRYVETPIAELPHDLGCLTRFSAKYPAIVRGAVRALLDRSIDETQVGGLLADLFAPYADGVDGALILFSDEPELLQTLYLAADAGTAQFDHDARAFDAILSIDPQFVSRWIEAVFTQNEFVTRHYDTRDYAILWRRPDAHETLRRVVDAIQTQPTEYVHYHPYLTAFFRIVEGTPDADRLRGTQEAFLDDMITCHCEDAALLAALFEVVAEFTPDRRQGRLATLLACNQDFDTFRKLALEPRSWGWSGSAVPMYQRRIEYLQSLLPLFAAAALLQHRVYIQKMIDSLHQSMEREKKRDFMSE